MLYAWIGFLKPDADEIPASVQENTSDFLGQPLIKIRAAGPLRDASGRRAGMCSRRPTLGRLPVFGK